MPDASDERQFASALLRRAEEERRRILHEAEAEAQQIRREAEAQLERLRAERVDAARRRAREHLGLRLSDIGVNRRAEEARLVDEARMRVLAVARERLSRMRDGPGHATGLGRMLDESLAELGSDRKVVVVVDLRDRETITSELQRRLLTDVSLRVAGPFLGGVQVVAGDGDVVIDNTFDARLQARLPAIHVRLAAIFGGPGTGEN